MRKRFEPFPPIKPMEIPGKYTIVDFKSKEERFIYDAALLDGCNQAQALRVMKGLDPDISYVPPLGWYRAKRTIADHFCREGENEITDRRN